MPGPKSENIFRFESGLYQNILEIPGISNKESHIFAASFGDIVISY